MSVLVTRPLRLTEWKDFETCLDSAFGWGTLTEEQTAGMQATFELERSLCTFDGDRLVGTAGAYSLSVGVPGNVVPMAGVTVVSVSPSHRRRGVLTGVMRRQLEEVAQAGDEALAGLWASEPAIYQRYGYGCAAWRSGGQVRAGASFSPGGRATLDRHDAPVRLVDADEALLTAGPVVEAVAERTPGALRRSPARWRRSTLDEPGSRGPSSRRWWVVTDGGYASYRLTPDWDQEGRPDGTVGLGELLAVTPEAYAALWRYVLDLDLVALVDAPMRPLHDPLLLLLADPREAAFRARDALWLRIVDVPRALQERSFSAPLDLNIAVHDPVLAANDRTWRVRVDDLGAAACEPTTASPDLELGIGDLSAAHLGSTGLAWLAQAGRVDEHTPGSLRAAARSWAWDVPAACLEMF